MSILDDYQNSVNDTAEEQTTDDPSVNRRKRSELERQIVILDSDLKKILREIEELEIQKRKFKKEEERIRVERGALDKRAHKLDNDRLSLEEEIRGLKKKLKILV